MQNAFGLLHEKSVTKDRENKSVRTVEGGSSAQCRLSRGETASEERYRAEEGGGSMMKFRGVKEWVTATQTLHAAW